MTTPNITEFARMVGVTRQAVQNALRRGTLRRPLTAAKAKAWQKRVAENEAAVAASRAAKIAKYTKLIENP
jgi:hypothetical protein